MGLISNKHTTGSEISLFSQLKTWLKNFTTSDHTDAAKLVTRMNKLEEVEKKLFKVFRRKCTLYDFGVLPRPYLQGSQCVDSVTV